MSTPSPMNKPEAPLNWDAASVELPPIPMIPPGVDAMSMTIAGVLPTLTAPLTASVAALQAKETMFSGKLGAAESAYQNADESGGQSVGQLTQMLGQVGSMAQQAGGAGGGMGSFGQIMQQAMHAAQSVGGSQGGGGSQAGSSQPSAGQGAPGGAAPQQQPREDESEKEPERASEKDERTPLDDARLDAAEPGGSRPGEGPVPVTPPERPPHDDDLARRV